MRPIKNRIIVKLKDDIRKTDSGIILPDIVDQVSMIGFVHSLGTGVNNKGKKEPFQVSEGDMIAFGPMAGENFEYDGFKYKVLEQKDIIAVIKPN